MENKTTTEDEFRAVLASCRNLFVKKMHDYGTAWSVMRSSAITDQLFIKACRIRTLEVKGNAHIDEGVIPEFVGLVNYSLMGLTLLTCHQENTAHPEMIGEKQALEEYDRHADEALQLMLRKNHDYDEAWRAMRISSYTDLILMKIFRTKQIEDLDGKTLVSEGISANYMDVMNYAVFALIKLTIE